MNLQLFSKAPNATYRRESERSGHKEITDRLQTIIQDSRKRIVILFGGCSSEYSVSLQSAYAVICHLDQKEYLPVLIGITKTGDWYLYLGETDRISEDTWCGLKTNIPVSVCPNRHESCLMAYTEDGEFMKKIPVDAVFPVLHGRNGEDGTVQGMFELAGIPVIGCGVLASSLCMDKDRAHKLVSEAGIRVPKSFVIADDHNENYGIQNALYQAESIGYPLFVKPVKAGSSYGVTKVCKRTELADAIRLAFQYDDTVIVEEAITGFEVGCAVMGNEELTVGEVDEIELQSEFFDFTEKYTLKTSAIHVPARIDEDTAEQIRQTARRIYQTLGCKVFSRVDMFLTENGEIVFNEVNTIPGFTSHSRFPNMMKAVGISFEQILNTVIRLGLETGGREDKMGMVG
ncbi:MAG: D-alanine--D-serine ligase VanG [Lachnospiraceae bacterium]|nr:D-alanine--D-serine ligase VanG [Lachnospiraceae bacterium]